MARLFDVEIKIQSSEKVYVSLMKSFGIGKRYSLYLCQMIGFNKHSLCHQLTREKVNILTRINSKNRAVGLELKRLITFNLHKMAVRRCHKGVRHSANLPVNGQNTKNNRKTARKLNKIKRLL